MGDPHRGQTFPRGVLLAAGGMIALSITLTVVAQATGVGSVHLPKTTAVQTLEVNFVDRADGTLAVIDAKEGIEIAAMAPGSNGFVRGVLRGLARDRKLESIGPEKAFRLTRWADGRLSIEDLATQRRVDLGAFGHTNSEAFAGLLSAGVLPRAAR